MITFQSSTGRSVFAVAVSVRKPAVACPEDIAGIAPAIIQHGGMSKLPQTCRSRHIVANLFTPVDILLLPADNCGIVLLPPTLKAGLYWLYWYMVGRVGTIALSSKLSELRAAPALRAEKLPCTTRARGEGAQALAWEPPKCRGEPACGRRVVWEPPC